MATRPDPFLELVDDIASFTHDPLAHARYAYPWGEGDLLGVDGPRTWQADVMGDIRDHLTDPATRHTPCRISVASGHGIGKSALIAMLSKWGMDTCEDCKVVLTANTEPQLRTKTMPEVAKWSRLAITADWFKITASALASTVPGHDKSWRLDAVTWSKENTEAFAGLHNLGKRIIVIYDEASGIDDKVWEVTLGALTDENTEIIWIAFGNPTKNTGKFRETFGRMRDLWKTRQIDSRTVEGTNKAYLQELVDTYGEDSDIVKVRVRGLFPSASSLQFIPSSVVDAARKRTVPIDYNEPVVMGVDVARFGDDASTIYFRRGRNGAYMPPIKLRGVDTMTLASKVAEQAMLSGASVVNVDEGGIGAGVVDRLVQMNVPVRGVQFGARPEGLVKLRHGVKVANRRAELWAVMREWLEGGVIPDDQSLSDDLTGVEYGFDANDRILLEKKEHMKKRGLASPDDGDGLALTFATQVLPAAWGDDEDRQNAAGRYESTGY